MSTRINHNILSMSIQRNIGQAQNSLDTAINRLSSGLRINNSWDDAAGLAVSEKFRAQISGMGEAEKNANYNINLLSTADGALNIIDEKLIRMRQLAVQASNGALTASDRSFVNIEFQQMKKEINRIASVTNYNNVKLIDGSLSSLTGNRKIGFNKATVDADAHSLKFHIGANNKSGEDYYFVNIGSVTTAALGLGQSEIPPTTEAEFAADNNLIHVSTGSIGNVFAVSGAPADIQARFDPNQTFQEYSEAGSGNNYVLANDLSGRLQAIRYHNNGSGFDYTEITDLGGTIFSETNVLDTATAQDAIVMIDQAIQSKDTIRSFIGSLVNRLQNNILELQISKENAQSSESMIRDTDVASEMSGFTRAQILFNSGISMMSQSSNIQQNIASLMG